MLYQTLVTVFHVINQKRVRVFDRGFEKPRNMKARGRRPSAFIVSRCLETPVKHDARIFDLVSKTIHTSLVIRGDCFSALISLEIMYFNNNQNVGILLLFVVSHVVVKMAESFAANTESRFCFPKTGEEESNLLQGSILKSTACKTKWAIKFFREWQINRKVKVPVLDAGDLSKVQSLSTDLANVDANALNYWLSKFGCE